MIDDMPIYKIVAYLAAIETDTRRRLMLNDMSRRMEKGVRLTEIMVDYDEYFSPLAVQMIDLCYNSGEWAEILVPFADYLESEWRRNEKIRSEMIYPGILAVLLFGAAFIIIGFVVPSFAALFGALNAELPLPTRMLIAVSEICDRYAVLFLPVTAFVLATFNLLRQTKDFRRRVDEWSLRLPLIGLPRRQNIWSNVLNSLAVLLKSGTYIDDALQLTAKTADNMAVRNILRQAYADVTSGRCPLAVTLGKSDLFPPLAAEFISVGEKSGNLDFMLAKAAEYCRMEADNQNERLAALAQPMVILVLAGLVMWLVLAVVMPLWSAVDAL